MDPKKPNAKASRTIAMMTRMTVVLIVPPDSANSARACGPHRPCSETYTGILPAAMAEKMTRTDSTAVHIYGQSILLCAQRAPADTAEHADPTHHHATKDRPGVFVG
jgi:hypothetical protein